MTSLVAATEVIVDGFDRVDKVVRKAVEGLTDDELVTRIDPDANTVAWLVWHLTRIQDDHVADVARTEQVWTAGGWSARFGLPFDVTATGRGHASDDVAQVGAPGDLLQGYFDAVVGRTREYVAGLSATDLARIVDERWDPPVTLAVRLVSLISDNLQHAGQAVFVRGILLRRRPPAEPYPG